MSELDRFFAKVRASSWSACWVWIAYVNPGGYGVFRHAGGQLAHRYAYREARGKIPKGLQIDHLCRTRRCVNPVHLEAVTQQKNMKRGLLDDRRRHYAFRNACAAGHAFTPENTRERAGGSRICRTCDKIRARRYRRRQNV